MPTVTLITPTRDRPLAFQLCERWVGRQTRQPHQWIVVDDGDQKIVPTRGQLHLRRAPSDETNTLPQNLLEALPHVTGESVIIIEDDEWYAPDYVELMVKGLHRAELAGERHARYYHVQDRRWLEQLPNQRNHCSLCRTGFRNILLPRFKEACEASLGQDPFVDMRFWGLRPGCKTPTPKHVNISLKDRPLSVGIKGLPGRGGLGASHRRNGLPQVDETGAKLVDWIGAKEAQVYLELPRGAPCT